MCQNSAGRPWGVVGLAPDHHSRECHKQPDVINARAGGGSRLQYAKRTTSVTCNKAKASKMGRACTVTVG